MPVERRRLQMLADLKGHTGRVNSAVFSNDGKKIVTASFDHTAKIWEAATGKLLADLNRHSQDVGSAVFSPDDNNIITALEMVLIVMLIFY